jgi:hypothetical protein
VLAPPLSDTFKVKEVVVGTVGVPEIVVVAAVLVVFRERPVGRTPAKRLQVYGALPPFAVSV